MPLCTWCLDSDDKTLKLKYFETLFSCYKLQHLYSVCVYRTGLYIKYTFHIKARKSESHQSVDVYIYILARLDWLLLKCSVMMMRMLASWLNRDRTAEYQSNSYTTLNCHCFHIKTKQNIRYLIKHHGHFGHFGKMVGCLERIRLPSSQSFYYFQAGKLNVNRYATKKTVTQGKIKIYVKLQSLCEVSLRDECWPWQTSGKIILLFMLGMLDIALLTTNASQLKYVLSVRFFYKKIF